MAVQVELCCLESFPAHLNPLDALILKSNLPSVFQNDTDPPVVLFTPQRPQGSGRPGVLLRVHTATEEETAGRGERNSPRADTESGCRVRLYTSRFFMRHHGLQRLGSSGTVRVLEPVSLDRVVLGARSRQSLRWAGAEQFTGALLELCRTGQWLLARQGDPLLLPRHPLLGEDPGQQQLSDLMVLECSPVTQGRITADTSLVLTDCWDSVDPPGAPPPCRPLRLCVSDFAHYADGLGGGRSLLDNRKLLGSGFSGILQALECRVDVRVVDSQRWTGVKGQQGAAVDVDSCVFVSKQLLLRLGLFNQEWVKLSRVGGSPRPPAGQSDVKWDVCRDRLVSVVVVDLTQSPDLQNHDEAGFISATLWFNMTEGEAIPANCCSLRMKRWRPSPPEPGGRSDSSCRSASPPFARELHIQPVVSLYNNLSCYDNLLSEHFSTPRLVSQGDILSVPAEKHPDLLENNSEGIHRCPVLFFRVQKVCPSVREEEEGGGGAHLADRLHTSLYMGASTNSPVPCCSVDGASLWSGLSPPGLNRTVDLISSIILPHLYHSSLSGCTILLHGPAGSGKVTVVGAASRRLNLHLLKVDCVSVCADTPAASEVKLTSAFQRADAVRPCILLLRNLQLLLRPRGAVEEDGRVRASLCQLLSSAPTSVAVVATVCRPRDLSAGVVAAFVHQVALESPTEEQRRSMLVSLSRDLHLGRDVNLERLAKLTAGFVLGDLRALLAEAGRAACRRLIHTCGGRREEDLCSSGVTVLNQDFTSALDTLQDAQSKSIGAPKQIPHVRWEDVGGLQQVKKEILDTVQLPLQRPELLSLGLNRTGVLLYGPPGTGKTLLAKAVATECSMTFLSVKGPELINMYVGQSEENIREVFCRARSAAPCVVFFDELDSLAPSRGRSGDSGGVMDRVVSQLLAELDALHSSVGVFVIGATNRPDLLDQSLLRPGRFDKLVYVGINEDRVSQLQVLQAILRKFQLDPMVNLQEVVDRCPTHMTGADLYALCSDAMTASIKRKISLIDSGLDSEDSPVLLSVEDFSTALENFKPSVSDQELLRYKNIQQKLTVK
ncbi:peroxisome assembly factor 2 isoform X3 [Toxotes jaculatrix]|uniref:peroxisome assembly factor 2 isoform X3 n=1 Tax=Toxotes jaculatrix TaxID=941984 RepID=UPI001B3ADBB4|nr:peroxisome assembly factor 2 isoform X3 [Toxotes jaculatrix]